ncbi:MAG TPA: TrbI/VirB10 family protein [Acidobacteriaceae bacterium]|jgi:hypothetical protein|nr:TrbI/VirB10 family protein [Acidobacteriaceae bacterium]
MITQCTVALMVASLMGGQVASAPPAGVPSGASSEVGSAAGTGSLVVPAGTPVPLTLVTAIQSKTTKVGDTVRAVVAFPVTVGAQVAIPAGTYVEGMVNAVSAHGPSVQIHFTRMLFANGYSVPLDAMNTQAAMEWPDVPQRVGDLAWGGAPPVGGMQVDQADPTNPTLPPLPQEGPSKAAVIGGVMGGMAAIVVVSVLTMRRRGSGNYVLFDGGWQFQMTLTTPLTLDTARLPAAS